MRALTLKTHRPRETQVAATEIERVVVGGGPYYQHLRHHSLLQVRRIIHDDDVTTVDVVFFSLLMLVDATANSTSTEAKNEETDGCAYHVNALCGITPSSERHYYRRNRQTKSANE